MNWPPMKKLRPNSLVWPIDNIKGLFRRAIPEDLSAVRACDQDSSILRGSGTKHFRLSVAPDRNSFCEVFWALLKNLTLDG